MDSQDRRLLLKALIMATFAAASVWWIAFVAGMGWRIVVTAAGG